MKEKMNKGSLYRKLVGSYVVFSLLTVFVFILCLVLVSAVVSKGNLPGLVPYTLSDQKSCEKAMPGLENIKGWIEELDENYQVRSVMGEKRTKKESYTPLDLFRLTSPNTLKSPEFVGFLNERTDKEGYYLVILGRTEMQLNTTLLYGPDNSDTRWEKLFLILFFGLFAGMTALMAHYLSRRIKRPLMYLAEGMERVRKGERDVRLDFHAEAEFAAIRDAFHVMSRGLEDARREKEEAERKKNKMLLELSHDIRTPIATICSYALALLQGLAAKEDLKKYYETIQCKAERINLLTEDMFTMLKMQSSEYPLHRTREDICEFLRRECAEYFEDAQAKGLEMLIDIPEQPIWMEADYYLLKRVMGNLLSNAMKYNSTGSKIAVTLHADETRNDTSEVSRHPESNFQTRSGIWIKVEDDGEPVAEELREHLFDDFTRGDPARKTDGGSGLGLSISKAIVEKHGGELSYQYTGKRNCFLVYLTVSRQP